MGAPLAPSGNSLQGSEGAPTAVFCEGVGSDPPVTHEEKSRAWASAPSAASSVVMGVVDL